MHPYFFHTAAEPLFGIYAPPRSPRPSDEAVLLCPPVGHEYGRAHWAMRQLASQLAQAGLHVFRFDYTGLGDSWGRFEDVSLARWTADVRTALAELAESAGVARVSVVGLRFGAALAFEAARQAPVDRLILWDPVVQGSAYLDQLRSLQADRRTKLWPHAAPVRPGAGDEELLGFRYGAALVRDLAALDLLTGPPPRAKHVRLIASAERPEYRALHKRFLAGGQEVALSVYDDAGDWDVIELFGESVLPGPLQRALVDAFK
jgi:alpha-beta hydrolase superfamily lysophospholipase